MPTVALIGPELFPIPPIRGGAAELFIEKVADHFTNWRPVVIGVSDPDLPRHETRGQAEYHRVPLEGWRRWLYCRYRNYFPLHALGVYQAALGDSLCGSEEIRSSPESGE